MSSRREVLIRILALLQRKTLIETKNRTLKWHYWTVRSIKNVALLTEDGAFALFFRPHPGGFDSSRVPTPEICHPRQKKNAIALHKPDVCEAKQPKKNYSIKRNTSVQQTLWEPRE